MSSIADFGRYLRQQRELRGLSLDDVVRNTKIPPTLVMALEEGQAERFPERVFVLNYVRSYAQVVGLSPDDVALRFEELPEAEREVSADPVVDAAVRRDSALTTAWLVLSVLLFSSVALALWQFSSTLGRYTHR